MSPTTTTTSDITIIASRVQSLEGRLDDNIDKINTRLDLIVDLMQKVTALQEREISNAVQISEIKASVKETNQTIVEWNRHLHERMDRHYVEVKTCKSEIDEDVSAVEKDLISKVDVVIGKVDLVEQKNQDTREEFQKWFNRGIGAWALASILLIVLQSAGAYVIGNIIDEHEKSAIRIDRFETRLVENERRISDIWKYASEKHGPGIAP